MDSPIVEPVDVVKCCQFDLFDVAPGTLAMNQLSLVQTAWCLMSRCVRNFIAGLTWFCSRNAGGEGFCFVFREGDEAVLDRSDVTSQFGRGLS